MAEPTDAYPESATQGGREVSGDGEAALRDALAEHGGDLAAAIEATDELDDILTTAVLVVASADDAEVDHVTESTTNLVEAVDGLTTAEAAAFAGEVGANADDLASTMETVLELEREGHLEELVELAEQLSALEIEPEAVAGANTFLAAVADAESEAEPVGFLGMLRGLRSADARAGLGYLVEVVKAIGRRRRK